MSTPAAGYPCLASLEALWNSPTQDVAAAILGLVFAPKLDKQHPEVRLFEIESDVGDALSDVHLGLIRNPRQPPLTHIRTICLEAILLLEHRYMVARHSSYASDNTDTVVRLLRAGRAAIESGDPRAALG